MSCNNWESGTLKIPTKAWKTLRDGLVTAFNARQTSLYELALKVHALLVEAKKTTPRGKFSVHTVFQAVAQKGAQTTVFRDLERLDGWFEVQRSLTAKTEDGRPDDKKLRLPKKLDFALAVATKTTRFQAGEGSIGLIPLTKELTWHTGENNHAVEHARESVMGQALFTLLSRIEWLRGTGGEFVGNDEYNRDNRDNGGGANYVTSRFAFKSKAERDAEKRQGLPFRHNSFGSMRYR